MRMMTLRARDLMPRRARLVSNLRRVAVTPWASINFHMENSGVIPEITKRKLGFMFFRFALGNGLLLKKIERAARSCKERNNEEYPVHEEGYHRRPK